MALKELDADPALRDDPSLKDINDVVTLAKTYRDTKAFVGSSLRPPGPNASEAEKQDFYAKLATHAPHLVPLKDGDAEAEKVLWGKLGRPADPKNYAFKVPDGVDLNLDMLREAAVAGGLTQKQFEQLAAKTVTNIQAGSAKHATDLATLKTEWATAYESKLRDAAAVATKLGQPETVVAAILAGKLSVSSLKGWDAVAVALGKEEGQGAGIPGNGSARGGMTREEATKQFQEIQRNQAYYSSSAPEHDQLVKEGLRLQGLLNPG